MLGVYNYTVVLTYISTLISFFGVTLALAGDARRALICLMLSGLCDMFDGQIAATKKDRTVSQRRFGIQIDSLSDLICFGVLPAIIVYSSYAGESILSAIFCPLYLLCALIRLAWFNVDEEERQQTTAQRRDHYLGLPVTSLSLLLPAVICAGYKFHWPLHIITPILLGVTGVAFLTPFRLKKPHLAAQAALFLLGVAVLVVLRRVVA